MGEREYGSKVSYKAIKMRFQTDNNEKLWSSLVKTLQQTFTTSKKPVIQSNDPINYKEFNLKPLLNYLQMTCDTLLTTAIFVYKVK